MEVFWYAIVVLCVAWLSFKAGRSFGNSDAVTVGIKITLIFFYKFISITKSLNPKQKDAFTKSLNRHLSTDAGVNSIMNGKIQDDADV
jgi:hypothetical protein